MSDPACEHEDFEVVAEVNRISNTEGDHIIAYGVDVAVSCTGCSEKFRWVGVAAGLRPDQPMVSVDEFTLHAPIRPASSDPDFGLGIPGFAIRGYY